MGLSMILSRDATALAYAVPYLRIRSISMVATLISATGFAAYRGLLSSVTPLKVSLAANLINIALHPLQMFGSNLGFTGAAWATVLAEIASGATYLRLLLRRRLVTLRLLALPPSLSSLIPLLKGGTSLLLRQLALNVGFIAATRRAQAIDPTGWRQRTTELSRRSTRWGSSFMLPCKGLPRLSSPPLSPTREGKLLDVSPTASSFGD